MEDITRTRVKWDKAARTFDLMNGHGPERRWAPIKRKLFSAMSGRVLFVAAGTGLDFQFFPPGQTILALDISPEMLKRAREKAERYDGDIELAEKDIQELDLADGSFDQVHTSCTFCSVPDPVRGLEELRRVLVPGGELHMFEHTGSRIFPINVMLNLLTPLSRKAGPELNRDTPANVEKAGFQIREVNNVYLDFVRTISAVAPR